MKLILFLTHWSSIQAAYDYIVVGSGTGGGTVATELALKKYKVLLIEAGPDYFAANQSTPVFHGKSSEDPAISYDFNVEHATNGRSYFYPRASALGGCSIHNAQITVYPGSADFDYMQDITGDSGWAESTMREYFVRLERNQYPLSLVTRIVDDLLSNILFPIKKLVSALLPPLTGHGFDGWFSTSIIDLLRQLTIDDKLLDIATAEIGDPLVDINGYGLLGGLNTDQESSFFVPQSVDVENYSRANFPSYIKSVAAQGYLTIMTDTFVTRVLIDANNKAYGVEYSKGRYLYRASPLSTDKSRKSASTGQVLADREVILSGGTFNTPQLLMLSGIGDEEQLKAFDIPVKQHLPGVGRNMMDRYEVSLVNKYPEKLALLRNCKFLPNLSDPCYKEYVESNSGPYISNGIISGTLQKSHSSLSDPDLFILGTISDFHGYYRGYSNVLAQNTDSFTRLILKARTNNTNGYVRLASADPFDVPEINFQSFTEGDHDLNVMVEAIKDQRKFVKNHFKVSHVETQPGSHVKTDEQIRDFVLDQAWGHHACCTARMGKDENSNAVLNSKFQVRGIQNLRVVDASAIPRIPGYFPAVFIHMMAMKAADVITSSHY